jgi:hypothetical protein
VEKDLSRRYWTSIASWRRAGGFDCILARSESGQVEDMNVTRIETRYGGNQNTVEYAFVRDIRYRLCPCRLSFLPPPISPAALFITCLSSR